MLILGIDTATQQVGCAIGGHEGVLAAFQSAKGRRHAETLVPAIEFLCSKTRIELSEIGAVAVDVGPGLFTGLRVGVATAKALGFALARPVVTASSLELLALGAARAGLVDDGSQLVAVVDARRGQLFSARFRAVAPPVDEPGAGAPPDPVVAPTGEELLSTPEELAAELADVTGPDASAPVVCVGDGALRHGAVLSQVPGVRLGPAAFAHPDPAVLALVGVARLASGDHIDASAVVARYLREADVRINWEQRIVPRAVEA